MHIVAGRDVVDALDMSAPHQFRGFGVIHQYVYARDEPCGGADTGTLVQVADGFIRVNVDLLKSQHNIQIAVIHDGIDASIGEGNAEITHHQRTEECRNIIRFHGEGLVVTLGTTIGDRRVDAIAHTTRQEQRCKQGCQEIAHGNILITTASTEVD